MKVCSMDGTPIDPSPDFPAFLVQTSRSCMSSSTVATLFNVSAEVFVFTRTEIVTQEHGDAEFSAGDRVLHLIHEPPQQTSDGTPRTATTLRLLAAPAGQDLPETLSLQVFTNKRSAHAFTSRWFIDAGFFIFEHAYQDKSTTAAPATAEATTPPVESNPSTPPVESTPSTPITNEDTQKLEV